MEFITRRSRLGHIGYSHIKGSFFAYSMHVKGKRVFNIPIPYPLYILLRKFK